MNTTTTKPGSHPINTVIFAIFGFPSLIAVSSIWKGYVLSILWAWFLVPAFSAPAITIPVAIGVALIVNFLTFRAEMPKKGETQNYGWHVFAAAFYPTMALLSGWIAHMFI